MQKRYYQLLVYVLVLAVFFWLVVSPSLLAKDQRFASVVPGYTLSFPKDYGAHPDFRIEWWYVTGWLETVDSQILGFQVTFFRTASRHHFDNPSHFAPKQLIIAHAALTDPALGRIIYDDKMARSGFGLAYAREGNTDVKLDNWYILRESDGRYITEIHADEFDFQLLLRPTQAILLQGDNGFSRKGSNIEQASYYYSEPHLAVSGTVVHQGVSIEVHGQAWLDHEWSSEILDSGADGWDWMSANLNDGSALMAFQIRGKDGAKLWAYAIYRNADGRVTHFRSDQVKFNPERSWTSPHTKATYPVRMRLRTGDSEWRLESVIDDQELDTRNSTGAVYWEGAVSVFQDQRHVGRGYLELTGYVQPLEL